MIARYTLAEMGSLWGEYSHYKYWQRVSLAVVEAWGRLGMIPELAVQKILQNAQFRVEDVLAREQETRHDFIAFLEVLAESVGVEGLYLHRGLTSSDIIDTALSLRLCDALDLLIAQNTRLLMVLKTLALRYKHSLCMGRSHGVHAEPTSFGLKMASFYAAFKRDEQRLRGVKNDISYLSISGPVGTFASVLPEVEAEVAKILGLKQEWVATQVIPRDRHAWVMSALAVLAGNIERISIEIRHLQRTELREVEEGFAAKQKGSSAMPHKKNPIMSENLTGLARQIRAYLLPTLENIALWHERDMSHSSVERISLADAFILADYALQRLTEILENLQVYPRRMAENMQITSGLYLSQRVLLALVDSGMARAEAYAYVQKVAMKVWAGEGKGSKKDFIEAFRAEYPELSQRISSEKWREIGDLTSYIRYVDYIFTQVFNS